jgi:NADPH:quinone reductase-like Zn-dependent oxidoreductase
MRAVILPAYGSAAALVVGDMPEPSPGPGEIKVRVAAAGLNPIDWKQRSGLFHKYMPLQLPTILGRDVSGEVVALGEGVTSPAIGARVCGLTWRTYAEYVVAPVSAWAELPAGMDLVDAAALPLALLTGAQLVDAADLREGDKVLVTGATGAVGRVAVYLAKTRGATVYAGVRARHAAEAANLGAHAVIALDDARQLEKVPQLDALADTVGGETTQALLPRLKTGGRIGSIVGEPPGAKERGLVARAFFTVADAPRLTALVAEVAAGKLTIPIARRMPLAEAAQAHAVAELGGGGKVLLLL